MSLDLCLKQLHVIHINVFPSYAVACVCSCSTPSFFSPANSSHPYKLTLITQLHSMLTGYYNCRYYEPQGPLHPVRLHSDTTNWYYYSETVLCCRSSGHSDKWSCVWFSIGLCKFAHKSVPCYWLPSQVICIRQWINVCGLLPSVMKCHGGNVAWAAMTFASVGLSL